MEPLRTYSIYTGRSSSPSWSTALTQQDPKLGSVLCTHRRRGTRKLLEHNHRFSHALLPMIDEDRAAYGSIASSHLNLALRLCQQGAYSPSGDLQDLIASNHTLKDVVRKGHKWWILQEDTPSSGLGGRQPVAQPGSG